jgi:hypothetical protein
MTTLKPIAPSSTAPDEVEQHSLPATVAYHLLPGLLILAVTVAAAPVVRAACLPPIAALVLALLVAQLPVQLGHLLIQGWRCNGRLSLAGVVLYREPLRWWLYPLMVVGMLAWSWLMWFALTPISTTLKTTLFAWLPPGFAATSSADAAGLLGYPRSALLLTFAHISSSTGWPAPSLKNCTSAVTYCPGSPASEGRRRCWRRCCSPSTTSGSRGCTRQFWPPSPQSCSRYIAPATFTSESGHTACSIF